MTRRFCTGRVMVVALLFGVIMSVIAGGVAYASENKPENPRRQEMEETLAWMAGAEDENRLTARAGMPWVSLQQTRTPTLSTAGRWTATVSDDDGSQWEFLFAIQDLERDSDDYVYYGKRGTSQSFTFAPVTAGKYCAIVYMYRNGSNEIVSVTTNTFTVAGDSSHQTLEQKARSIVNSCRVAGDDWQTALNLHDWLTQHTYYDYSYEYYGADVLFRGYGVCDSYSKAYQLLCQEAGIDVTRVISRNQNHAWNAIKLDELWYHVDVTWDDPGEVKAAVSGKEGWWYYCLDDDTLAVDHRGGDWTFRGCESMDANYYVKTGTWEMFGKTGYNGNTDYTVQMKSEISSGKISTSLPRWGSYYLMTDADGNWWQAGLKDVYFAIYAAGLQESDWFFSDGEKVKVAVNWDDDQINVKVNGWDLEETGTLLIPADTEVLDEEALAGVEATTLSLSAACQRIEGYTFRNSGVRTVIVPEGSELTFISPTAFSGCGRLIFLVNGSNQAVETYANQSGDLVIAQK